MAHVLTAVEERESWSDNPVVECEDDGCLNEPVQIPAS